jgi:polyisoprenoid-binding protein YceI
MKNSPFLLPLMLLVFLGCTNAPDSDKATTTEAKEVTPATTGETLRVDPTASKLAWVATKVTGYHTGTVPIKNGEIQVRDGSVTGGRFVIDMANLVVSGPKGSSAEANMKLQGHLQSPDFFEVAAHPEASFEITGVKPFSGTPLAEAADPRQEDINEFKVANPTHSVSGNLTIKGVSKNIEFPAEISVSGNSVDARAKFNIDRSQWNLTYPGKPDDLIRNEIHMGLTIKAAK